MREKSIGSAVQSESSPVLSFEEQLKGVMQQCEVVEAVREDPSNIRLYMQMCKIITEVFRKNGSDDIRIDRQTVKASKVQEVFRQIRSDELRFVADNVCGIDYKIKFVKAYLTTALYNSVFESELGLRNSVNVDMKDGSV